MKHDHRFDHQPFTIPPGKHVRLGDYDPAYTAQIEDKAQAKKTLIEDVSQLAEAQGLLWASKDYGLIIIFQAMDAAGKDGTIKHVMSGVNPQGVSVYPFKAPTEEERLHHFLWRPARFLPERGRIAIFNRSYYEEVLVVRVHPQFLDAQWTPHELRGQDLERVWEVRYQEINDFEERLVAQGIQVIKFFLNVSRQEQKQRFLARLDDPEKNWKFSAADVNERARWQDYMHAYEQMLGATSTAWAPWYIIPADKKWFARACVADIITARIRRLDLQPPHLSDEERKQLAEARKQLEREKD